MPDDNEFLEFLGIDKQALDEKAKLARKKSGKGCVICNYTELVQGEKGSEFCSCFKNKMLQDIFKKANVPNVYIGKTIEDWNTRTDNLGNDLGVQQKTSERIFMLMSIYSKKINKICKGYPIKFTHSGNVTQNLHSIIFEGGIGSGKTFISSVMVQSAIRNSLSAKYYDWCEIIQVMTDYDKKEQLDEIVEDFKNMDFIAIDGVENYNYNHPQMPIHIDRISKARLHSGKPVFIMSDGNINSIQGGSGWPSLVRNCLTIRLPNSMR